MANFNVRKRQDTHGYAGVIRYDYAFSPPSHSSKEVEVFLGGDLAAVMRMLSKPRIEKTTFITFPAYNIVGGQFAIIRDNDNAENNDYYYWGENFTPVEKCFCWCGFVYMLRPSSELPVSWQVVVINQEPSTTVPVVNTPAMLLYLDGAEISYIPGQHKKSVNASREFYLSENQTVTRQFPATFSEACDFQTSPCDFEVARKIYESPFVVLIEAGGEPQIWQIASTSLAEAKSGVYTFNMKSDVHL